MYYLFIMRVGLFALEKIPGLSAFLDSNLHTLLAIVTGNELGLAFPPRNHPKNSAAAEAAAAIRQTSR